ncbi:MAG: sensor histidine kinase [Sphingobium sp.]|nr:sensor histidine kinase [Sphingobium sp.]
MRILLVEIMAIVAVLGLVPWMTISMLHQIIDGQQRRILERQADLVEAGLKFDRSGLHVELGEPLRSVYAKAFDGRAYLIIDEQGRVRAQSSGIARLPVDRIPLTHAPSPFHADHFIGVLRRIETPSGWHRLVIVQDETEPGAIIDDIARTFLWRYLALLTLLLISLPAINALSIRQLFRSVHRTSARATRIGPSSLDLRLDEQELPLEVVPLVRAINRLVDRLEGSIREQRSFIGNVVHELRTPLATLKIQVDRLGDASERARLNHNIDRLSHVISQLRDLAELETLDSQKESIELNDLARRIVAEMAPQVYEAGDTIELGTTEAPLVTLGSPVLLGLALRNLIDNAIRHTPSGTAIRVATEADGSIHVQDNGPGVETGAQDRVTTRFWRADQSRADTAGLGLSIVDRISAVHSATFHVGAAIGGGAIFSLRLPLRFGVVTATDTAVRRFEMKDGAPS